MASVISRPMGSLPWVRPSNRTSGSGSSMPTLSDTLTASRSRPSSLVPMENARTMSGCAEAIAVTSATISAWVWNPR